MDTIQDFQKEVNKWLKLQWQKADTVGEMPSLDDAASYMSRTFKHWMEYNEREVLKKIREGREGKGLPATNATLEVLTLMDFSVDRETQVIRLATATGTDNERTLCTFSTVMKHLEIDGEAADSVKSISVTDGDSNADLSYLAYTAYDLLSFSDKEDIVARWLSSNKWFRSQHPICPRCQSPVRRSGGDGPRPVICDQCDWESYRKYHYLTEFAEQDAFLKEQAATIREAKYIDDMDRAIEELDMAMKKVGAIYTLRKAPVALKGSYLDKLHGIFKKAMEEMAEEKKSLQKKGS